jgi:hypothetical protein
MFVMSPPQGALYQGDPVRLRHTGSARLFPDDDPHERKRWLATHLPSSAANVRAVRLFGTQLLSVRIDLDGWFVSRGVKIVRTAFLKIAEYKNSRSTAERPKALIPKSNPTMCHRCKTNKRRENNRGQPS